MTLLYISLFLPMSIIYQLFSICHCLSISSVSISWFISIYLVTFLWVCSGLFALFLSLSLCFWGSKDKLISDVLLWTPTYGQAKAGRPAWTYIQQLCEETECSPEDLPEAMNDREKWRERVRDIHAGGTTWWWWRWSVHYICWKCLWQSD